MQSTCSKDHGLYVTKQASETCQGETLFVLFVFESILRRRLPINNHVITENLHSLEHKRKVGDLIFTTGKHHRMRRADVTPDCLKPLIITM